MTTCLARVLYDTIIESVESRIRRDGWIQATDTPTSTTDDNSNRVSDARVGNARRKAKRAQSPSPSPSPSPSSSLRHQATSEGPKKQKQKHKHDRGGGGGAQAQESDRGTQSHRFNDEMEKVEEDNGAKNAQRQQISEETLQKVIARWHEKITETEAAPPVTRALNTRRYSRVDTGSNKSEQENKEKLAIDETNPEEKDRLGGGASPRDDPSQESNTSSVIMSMPMWAPPSIQHRLATSQTDNQEASSENEGGLHHEYVYSHGLNNDSTEQAPTEIFDNEGDEELEAILRQQFASGRIKFSDVQDTEELQVHIETNTGNQSEDGYTANGDGNVRRSIKDDDSDTIGSDLDDSEIEDALQGPVKTDRLQKENPHEMESTSQPNCEDSKCKVNVLVSKAVYSRRKQKHKWTVQLGPGVICIGGVDLIFSKCKLELDTRSKCSAPS